MKVNLKRFFRVFRKLLTLGGIAAATLAGGRGEAALVLSNGNFSSPGLSSGNYGSYFNVNGGGVTNWNGHNLYPGGGSNGNLNLMTEGGQSTGGLSSGQYVLAQRAADPVAVFSGGVGNTLNPASNPETNVIGTPSNGLYIDQTIGMLDSTDLTQSFSLSAQLLRALGPTSIYYGASPPTWAGAGITIGFVNGDTGAILAQKTISYNQSFPASDTTTTFSASDTVTWNAAGSGLPAGTPINVFVGFRLNPGLGNSPDYNTAAVNNLVLTSSAATSYPSLTWTGTSAASPTQWSTNGSVLNWSNSGTASAYTEGALVTFDDSVGAGSTTVAITAADVNPAGVIFNNSAKSYTLQGPFAIAGGAYLNVSGGGLVTVTNSNSYTGGTNISSGTLNVGNGGNSGSIGSGDIVVNGALIYSRSDSVTTLSTISGSGSVTQQGPGLMTLAGINAYTGPTNVSGGTLQIGNGDSATLASSIVNLSNSGVIAFNHSTTVNYGGAITGVGSVIKAGPGTLTLSGVNTYSNGTVVNAGTLVLTGTNTYTGPATVNGGTLSANSPLAGPATVNGGNLYVNSSLAGTAAVNGGVLGGSGSATAVSVAAGGIEGGENGIGTLTLTSLAYSGSGTFVTNGYANYAASTGVAPLKVTASGGLNPGAGPVTINLGGPIAVSSGTYNLIQYSGAIGGSGSSAFTLGTAPNISGRSALTYSLVNNPGSIGVNVSLTPVIWTGSVDSEWYATDTLPAPGDWTFSGGTTNFLPNDIVQFDNSTSAGASVDISSGDVSPAGVLVNNDGNHPYTFTGGNGIVGAASLTKTGTGTLTLSNPNSYSGGTTVNAGNLTITNGNAGLPAGRVIVNAGGSIQFAQTGEGNRNLSGSNFYIAGSGDVGEGAIFVTANASTLSDVQIGNVTLTADATIAAYDGTGLNSGIHYGEGANGTSLNLNGHTLTFIGGNNVEEAIFASNYITGQGTISVASGANLRLNGGASQNWTSGVLVLNPGAQFATYGSATFAAPVVINNGILADIVGTFALTGPITLSGTTSVNSFYLGFGYGNTSLLGNVSGSGGLVLNMPNGTVVLAGSNTYTGDTDITSGSLTLLNANALQGSTLVANIGTTVTLDSSVTSHAFTFGGLGGSLNLPLADNGGNSVALTVGGNNHSTIYLGALSGGGSLTKVGTGTLTLGGSNTYTGGTTVNAGGLNVNGSLVGAVAVNGGILGGSGSAGAVTVAAGGGIEGGYSGVGTLTLTSLAYSGSGVLDVAPALGRVPVIVSGSNGLTVGGGAGSVVVSVVSPPIASGAYPVLQYSGAIQGTGFSAFTLGTTSAGRCVTYGGLVNNPGEIDLNVVVTPVIWTGSTSTAWYATDTLPAPGNWTFAGSATSFQPNDIVQFDNSTAAGGTVDISNGDVLPAAVVFNNDVSHPYTITGVNGIGGAAQVVKNGAGIVIMTASNSYTGSTQINGGTLQIGNGATNGTIGAGLYNIAAGGRLYLNYATAVPAGSLTWSNDITGAGTLELNSAQAVNGTAQWGQSTPATTVFGPGFTGTLQVDNGRIDSSEAGLGGASNIIINANAQFLAWSGTYSQSITIAGNGWGEAGFPGALRAAGGVVTTWAGPITLSANAGIEAQNSANLTLTGPITGNFQLEFESAGPGTINLAPSGTTQNSYGSSQVDAGTTVIAGNQYAFSTGGLSMNGGVVETNGFSFSFANLSGFTGTIGNYSGSAASTITVGADNTSTVYGGALADGGSMSLALTKTGSGMLTLSASNGYSGGTTINGGTLQVGNVSAIPYGPGAGDVIVHSPAVLDIAGNLTNVNGLGGNGKVDDSVGGGILAVGNNGAVSTFSGTIQNSNSAAGVLALTVVGGGTLTLSGTNTYLGGTTVADGTLILTNNEAIADGTSLTVGNASAFPAPVVALSAPSAAAVTPVPEPGTMALLVAGAVAAILSRRRVRRA